MSREKNIIYIRKENINEYRTPLIPKDITLLINNGFTVYIQHSLTRIYSNQQYIAHGGIITNEEWYSPMFKDAIIIGIKELSNMEILDNHIHLYFSHSFKNQSNSEYILSKFINSNSKLYDFEYILDHFNKRYIAFGYYSGLVGGVLGLKQYYNKISYLDNINNLKVWSSYKKMIDYMKHCVVKDVKIAVIGSNGRCGSGVRVILDYFKLEYTIIDRNYDVSKLKEYDIIYNCILLDESYDKIWFDTNTKFNKKMVIVDISCDYSRPNNPIKLYNTSTTWKTPVFRYNRYVDIIAIDNLPSLLPKESSNYFSNKLVPLLLDFNIDFSNYWKNNLKIYYDKANKFNYV
jgi:saccharopine dehydrogenase (NAD+, L-lysine-forming)